ncbi:hypothetical protein [Modestobacter altitudinis]|uniref:hypothetical protein n=1 Tax=Modestobacter altitudinis TaxID=2213158 RepID=UPI00110D1C1B|nr:hypothetical protein [Modestobacter altitudinis]
MNVLPFPPPPLPVLGALELLADVRRRDSARPARADLVSDLERPWEPAGCSGELSAAVWTWCHGVAAWVNHEFAWRPAQMIPACWPHHPHIARELPVLAVLRWQAENSAGPELIEEWNRYAFPMFCDRMVERLGESTCRTGRHQTWPAESRYSAFLGSRPS